MKTIFYTFLFSLPTMFYNSSKRNDHSFDSGFNTRNDTMVQYKNSFRNITDIECILERQCQR